ncbi:MAG: TIR domain-containing protein [Candidatus Korobacteraceae bacterium]
MADIAISPDGNNIASCSGNITSIWDLRTRQKRAILEGHTSTVNSVRFSSDGKFLASVADDRTIRLWRCRDWECVAVIENVENNTNIGGLSFHPQQPLLAIKNDANNQIQCWLLDYNLLIGAPPQAESRRYVNAKVVLLGDTGVGKSGLGLVLSGQGYQPTDSTHGRQVWTFDAREVEVPAGSSQTREVLLWDLAGQPGYRLVHQLHLNEVAVALVVFDSRSETDPFSGVRHWVRALAQARRLEGDNAVPLRTYLVAARADRGGVTVTGERIRAVLDDLGLDGFFETSAKEGWQVTDLAQAIRAGIDWNALPMVSSNVLFDSIRQFLLEEKQQGRLLSTTDDLFRAFQRAQSAVVGGAELRDGFEACIGRVESRGLIHRLHFADLVLLQPELLDNYASAMVQAAKEEPDGLGFIPEKTALEGDFRLAQSERVTDQAQEKLLLIATVEELIRHEIGLKEITDRGVHLVFPSQFTKERPDAPNIPGKRVTFSFEGPLNNIYATLAVRLSQSLLFKREAMWQNVAYYTASDGGGCGIHLLELEEGRGELALFYDEQTTTTVRTQFEAYVDEHLRLRAIPRTVMRRLIRACAACGYVLPDDLVQLRLGRGATTIRCPACDETIIGLQEPSAAIAAHVVVAEMNRSADVRRDQDITATRLKGKIETNDYDVFLCHNSKDKEKVKAIGKRLKENGILPWLDVWDVRPGARWQDVLEQQLKSIKSVAVFIGPSGSGPWQDLEIQRILQHFAKHRQPIIPVILEGRKGRPQFPGFLSLWHVVDMRQDEPDPIEQLIWGITGEKKPFV